MNGLTHDSQLGSGDGAAARPAMVSAESITDPTVAFFPAKTSTDFYDDGTFSFVVITMGAGSIGRVAPAIADGAK